MLNDKNDKGIGKMPTEHFDLLVTFRDDGNFKKGSGENEELSGIEEIIRVLKGENGLVYVKESEFPTVVMVELKMDPVYAALKLKQAPTRVISQTLPVNEVVRTETSFILEKVLELARSKVAEGDPFTVKSILMEERYIEPQEELFSMISEKLIHHLNLKYSALNPKWLIQIEMMTENTGISVLRSEHFDESLNSGEFKEDLYGAGEMKTDGLNKL